MLKGKKRRYEPRASPRMKKIVRNGSIRRL
jgi:hypothetical protein